jgi:hypothetical protein
MLQEKKKIANVREDLEEAKQDQAMSEHPDALDSYINCEIDHRANYSSASLNEGVCCPILGCCEHIKPVYNAKKSENRCHATEQTGRAHFNQFARHLS